MTDLDWAELEWLAKEQLSAPLTLSRTLLVNASTVLALVERVREAERLASVRRDTIATYERENADWERRVHKAEARIEKVVRLRDRMEGQRDDIDESVRLSTMIRDLNAALTEGDEQ